MVTAGASLVVSVTAAADGGVAWVRFLVAGAPVFTATAAPYSYTFTAPTGAGSLMLGAEAADGAGNIGVAAPVRVTVQAEATRL